MSQVCVCVCECVFTDCNDTHGCPSERTSDVAPSLLFYLSLRASVPSARHRASSPSSTLGGIAMATSAIASKVPHLLRLTVDGEVGWGETKTNKVMRIRVKIRKKKLEDERGGNEGGKEDKKNNQTVCRPAFCGVTSEWLLSWAEPLNHLEQHHWKTKKETESSTERKRRNLWVYIHLFVVSALLPGHTHVYFKTAAFWCKSEQKGWRVWWKAFQWNLPVFLFLLFLTGAPLMPHCHILFHALALH